MNTFDKTITVNGEETELHFRLTLSGQQKLKKKYNETALATLFNAIDDAEILSAVMTEALSYKGNENVIKDGAEVYDLLVDSGMAGVEDFADFAMGIGVASGLVSRKQADAMIKRAQGIFEEAIEEADEKNR